mgnify:FL=1
MTNDINYEQLGLRIKHYRLKAHLTQEQLAEKVDVATSTIAHAENGTSKPSLPLLIKISRELQISVDQLICDSLPIVDSYLDKDFADLLADCSTTEKRILLDIAKVAKQTIRRNRALE